MSLYPVVFKTTNGAVVFRTTDGAVVFKTGYISPYRNPQVMLQWSDDGGYTWSHEYWNTAGRKGERLTRVHWHKLGMSRDRVFRVTVSDPVKWIFIGARADIEKEKG